MSIIFCIDHIAHGLHKMCQVPLRCKMLWKKVSRWRSSLRSKVDSCEKIEHCAMCNVHWALCNAIAMQCNAPKGVVLCAMQLQCNAMLPKVLCCVLWIAIMHCNKMHYNALPCNACEGVCIAVVYLQCTDAMNHTAVQCSATLAKVLWLPPITAHCFRPQWATPIRLCFNANQSTAHQCNVSERSVQESVNCSEVGSLVHWRCSREWRSARL